MINCLWNLVFRSQDQFVKTGEMNIINQLIQAAADASLGKMWRSLLMKIIPENPDNDFLLLESWFQISGAICARIKEVNILAWLAQAAANASLGRIRHSWPMKSISPINYACAFKLLMHHWGATFLMRWWDPDYRLVQATSQRVRSRARRGGYGIQFSRNERNISGCDKLGNFRERCHPWPMG